MRRRLRSPASTMPRSLLSLFRFDGLFLSSHEAVVVGEEGKILSLGLQLSIITVGVLGSLVEKIIIK